MTNAYTSSLNMKRSMVLFLTLLHVALYAATSTWRGNTNTNWHTASNWDTGLIPSTSDDVVISSAINQPTISAAGAVAKSVTVNGDAILTIAAMGVLSINGATTQGVLNNGTIHNNGTLSIGATSSGGGYGIYNKALFNNNIGGIINIDRSLYYGIWNQNGTFTNAARLIIGANFSVGSLGILNYATINNTVSGTIEIERTGTGLHNFKGSFTNSGKITIGALSFVGNYGLRNTSTFNNTVGGKINIDNAQLYGLFNETGASTNFTNSGDLILGAKATVASYGIYNFAIFSNTSDGTIKIDKSTTSAFYNGSSTYNNFTNAGILTIGATSSVANNGIENYGMLNNTAGGIINIDRSFSIGFINLIGGTFTNTATLTIGATASAGSYGIYNLSTITNSVGGIININNTTNTGFYNDGVSTFNNTATLNIGATSSVGTNGIYNNAIFNNSVGGTINIDRTSSSGVNNFAGTFTNTSVINIGATFSVGNNGIFNNSIFNNSVNGIINIDRTSNAGVNNGTGASTNFTNAGTLAIGATSSVGTHGIFNSRILNNNVGGTINIDRSNTYGIYNHAGTITNAAVITIGAISSVGSTGIYNRAIFTNSTCSSMISILSNSILFNSNIFSNAGIIIESTSGNSSISSNTGIVQNLNGGTFTIGSGNAAIATAGVLWTGCTNSNWNIAGNWSTGIVPSTTDDVVISSMTNQPTISAAGAVAKSVTVNSGATLTIAAALSINGSTTQGLLNSGTVNNSGNLSIGNIVRVTNLINNNSGIFTNKTGGTLKGTGNILGNQFINAGGTLSPGYSPGYMAFNTSNNFTNSTMAIEVNGTTEPGFDFDQVVVNGTATLSGTLALSIGYAPHAGDQIIILSATNVTGTFSSVTGLIAGWSIKYTPTTVVLSFCATTQSSETITACDSYKWNGTTYTASGNYEFVTVNTEGCPHIITLHLTINKSTNHTTKVTKCDMYTWSGPLGNGTTYTASGMYVNITENAYGCTHTETLDLTI